jgi:acetyl-CoA carboxylase carboxyltransferase component
LLDEYQKRLKAGRALGGPEKLKKRSAQNKMNARQVLDCLCDKGSFREIGTLAGSISYHGEATVAADALVGGYANIEGQPAVVCAEDFSSAGGSIGHVTAAKKLRLASLALRERVPFIAFLDGAGARVSSTPARHAYAPNDMQVLAELSGKVPSIAVILGASAGHGAISGLLLDFIIMLEDSCLFAAGPPLVEAATGERISKEDLGGAQMHTQSSGVAHNCVKDEKAACQMIRSYLAYVPRHDGLRPPNRDPQLPECMPRSIPEVMDIIPSDSMQPYDMHQVIRIISDRPEDWFEFQPAYGNSLLTGWTRIGGRALAILANQPLADAGAITVQAARKASYFLNLCNNYNMPTLFLADNPGVMSGGQAEREGTLRAASAMFQAQCRLKNVPKIHITLRKAFGFGSSLMAMNPFDNQTLSLALPGINLSAMPAQGGAKAAGLSDTEREALSDHQGSSAWMTGDNLAHDEIVDPSEMRNIVLDALRMFKRDHAP